MVSQLGNSNYLSRFLQKCPNGQWVNTTDPGRSLKCGILAVFFFLCDLCSKEKGLENSSLNGIQTLSYEANWELVITQGSHTSNFVSHRSSKI